MTTETFKTKSKFYIFFSYFKRHKGLFMLDMCSAFAMSMIDLAYPYISRKAMYTWLPDQAYKTFFIVMGIVVLAYVLKSVLNYIVTYWGHMFGVKVEGEIRKDLFTHMQELSFSFFDNHRTGQLMSRVTSDLFEIVELAHHGPEDALCAIVTLVGSLIVLSTIEWHLALVVAVLVPIFTFTMIKLEGWRQRTSIQVKASMGIINNQIESSLSGIRTAKAFTNEETENKKFVNATGEYISARRENYVCMAVFNCSMEFFCSIMSVVVMCLGGYAIMRGKLNYIDLLTFTMYVSSFVTPIRRLVNLTETYASGNAGLMRFIEIMKIDPEIKDKDDAKILEVKDGIIEFDHVHFAYANGIEILKDINLKVESGETVAVVGSSGGGKTTMCQLVPRFYDVTEGSVKIDNQDVRDVTQKSLRESIGIVQQDVFLFADTILENIRYGKPDASDEEVIEAAKRAEIYDDIMKMPEGFSTFVGERGVLLSGGQKQRVAIARIFLKNPPILILDEATSALDSVTENRIQNAFDELAKGRTTLIIAHRLSTIRKANRILAVDAGKICEEGSHDELLAKDGIYASLYKVQSK